MHSQFPFQAAQPLLFYLLIFRQKLLYLVREKEKLIQTQLVKNARIPRKDFLTLYPDNLTKVRWVDSLMKEKKYKKDLLEKVK